MIWNDCAKTSPEKGEYVLTLWPVLFYRDDDSGGHLSDDVLRYDQHVVEYGHNGRFEDPPYADAIGDWFGDDHEVAEQPTHWCPLPTLPDGIPQAQDR